MSLTLKFDQASYRNSLNRFVGELKADGVLLLKEEMRLLIRDVIAFTPPKSQKQGENAIKSDLFGGRKTVGKAYTVKGIFQRIGSSTLVPPRNKSAAGETVGVNLGWERSKNIRIMRKFWKPNATMAEMTAFHKRYQNKNTGRVSWVSQHDIGRWKVQDQMWVSNATADCYYNMLASRVGFAKAGWSKAARNVGITALR